jgi:hypothetical protein
VLAEKDRERLLRVVDRLSTELGYAGSEEIPGEHLGLGGEDSAMVGILKSEDELLAARLRRGLAKVAAAALDGTEPDLANQSAVGAVLDGTEMVIRGELVMGNAGQLPALLPGFVFLVTLPAVDQDKALELSKRCARLVEGALGVD